jgi:hypothetical protein
MIEPRKNFEGRMVVHDAEYRVVVVRNPDPAHEDDATHAYCVDQDLAGRGKDVASALHDLASTLTLELMREFEESLPEYQSSGPDEDLVKAFERKVQQVDDMQVLRVGTLCVQLERVALKPGKSEPELRAEVVKFRPAAPAIPA